MWPEMSLIGWSSASRLSREPSVSIIPGLTQFTRTPCGAPSAASWRVSAMTAPFDAEWAVRWLVREPVSPAVEPTVRTQPRLRTRCGQAARTVSHTESSSARMVNAKSLYGWLSIGPNRTAPALAYTMSTPPNASTASSTQARTDCSSVRSEEHTSELQSRENLVCRLLLEKKKKNITETYSASLVRI